MNLAREGKGAGPLPVFYFRGPLRQGRESRLQLVGGLAVAASDHEKILSPGHFTPGAPW